MLETGPKQIEFGHVCEDPDEWEQRYERRDEETKRYQGKVGFSAHALLILCMWLHGALLSTWDTFSLQSPTTRERRVLSFSYLYL